MSNEQVVQLILLISNLSRELKTLSDESLTIDDVIYYNNLVNSCNALIEKLERSL